MNAQQLINKLDPQEMECMDCRHTFTNDDEDCIPDKNFALCPTCGKYYYESLMQECMSKL